MLKFFRKSVIERLVTGTNDNHSVDGDFHLYD